MLSRLHLLAFAILVAIWPCKCFQSRLPSRQHNARNAKAAKPHPYLNCRNTLPIPIRSKTALNIDIFGLGPSEIIIIAVVAGVLYGPDNIMRKFKDPSVNLEEYTGGWEGERTKDIDDMRERARRIRRARAIDRIEASLRQNADPKGD